MVSIFIFDGVTVKTENNEVSLYRAFVFMYFPISGIKKLSQYRGLGDIQVRYVEVPLYYMYKCLDSNTGQFCNSSTLNHIPEFCLSKTFCQKHPDSQSKILSGQ